MKFVPLNDPILTKVAKKIPKNKINSSDTREIVETMLTVAHGQQKNEQSSSANKKRPIMVGLAAPQIRILKRIILVDVKADGKGLPATPRKLGLRGGRGKVGDLKVYINPEIIWKSKEKEEWYEGCYSTGRVCGIVSRPVSIKIRAFVQVAPQPRLHLNIREEKYSGYVARIFQHEIDHLNGKVFPDLIKNPDHLHWVLKKEFQLYRDKQAWKNWSKKCSFEKWQSLKNPLLKTA